MVDDILIDLAAKNTVVGTFKEVISPSESGGSGNIDIVYYPLGIKGALFGKTLVIKNVPSIGLKGPRVCGDIRFYYLLRSAGGDRSGLDELELMVDKDIDAAHKAKIESEKTTNLERMAREKAEKGINSRVAEFMEISGLKKSKKGVEDWEDYYAGDE